MNRPEHHRTPRQRRSDRIAQLEWEARRPRWNTTRLTIPMAIAHRIPECCGCKNHHIACEIRSDNFPNGRTLLMIGRSPWYGQGNRCKSYKPDLSSNHRQTDVPLADGEIPAFCECREDHIVERDGVRVLQLVIARRGRPHVYRPDFGVPFPDNYVAPKPPPVASPPS